MVGAPGSRHLEVGLRRGARNGWPRLASLAPVGDGKALEAAEAILLMPIRSKVIPGPYSRNRRFRRLKSPSILLSPFRPPRIAAPKAPKRNRAIRVPGGRTSRKRPARALGPQITEADMPTIYEDLPCDRRRADRQQRRILFSGKPPAHCRSIPSIGSRSTLGPARLAPTSFMTPPARRRSKPRGSRSTPMTAPTAATSGRAFRSARRKSAANR